MELAYRCCAGIDVHKRILAVCVTTWNSGKSQSEKWTAGTTTGELRALAQKLVEQGVEKVAMESTGVYFALSSALIGRVQVPPALG